MNERKIVIGMWIVLIVLSILFASQSYVRWQSHYKQCEEAKGTLFHDRYDYICIRTKAIIPLQ